jgi:hypothetical protein
MTSCFFANIIFFKHVVKGLGLGLGNTIACDCDLLFAPLRLDLQCYFEKPYCALGVFCGTPAIGGTYPVFSRSPAYTTFCFDITNPTEYYLKDLCIKSLHRTRFRYQSCQAAYDGRLCGRCEVCPNGITTIFQCGDVGGPNYWLDCLEDVAPTDKLTLFATLPN